MFKVIFLIILLSGIYSSLLFAGDEEKSKTVKIKTTTTTVKKGIFGREKTTHKTKEVTIVQPSNCDGGHGPAEEETESDEETDSKKGDDDECHGGPYY